MHIHTQSNSLKRSVSPGPHCGTSKAKENCDHSAVPDKAKRCTVHSHEGKRRGSSWEVLATETCFCKTNETPGSLDLQCCVGAGGPRSHRPLLPCYEEARVSMFVEVLLFDHALGTVITVSSSSFPGDTCSRVRAEFLFFRASAAIPWQTLQWQPGPPRAPLAEGQPGSR